MGGRVEEGGNQIRLSVCTEKGKHIQMVLQRRNGVRFDGKEAEEKKGSDAHIHTDKCSQARRDQGSSMIRGHVVFDLGS